MTRLSQTTIDAEHATALYCLQLRGIRTLPIGSRIAHGDTAAAALANASARRRHRIGGHLLGEFRTATDNPTGPIDWNAFHLWLKDHMPELTAASIIVKVLCLLLLL